MKIRVFAGGGLGNQIWQYTFMQHLRLVKHVPAQFCHLQNIRGLQHTKISLLSRIQAQSFKQTQISWVPGGIQTLFNPWNNYPLDKIWGVKYDFREFPFLDPKDLKVNWETGCVVGYFQNKNFLEGLEKLIYEKLDTILQNQIPDLEKETKFEVIHVRGGDTTSAKNRKEIGLLSSVYYKSLLPRKCSITRVVVTDDISRARQVLNGIEVDTYFDDSNLDVFQTLKLMSSAQRLVAANSTLSWWGGFLSSQHGCEVIIPIPFFADKSNQASECLKYSKFQTSNSDFI